MVEVEVNEPDPTPKVTLEREPSSQPEELRVAVLKALSEAGQRLVANVLETGEWKLEGNEVVIKVASSATVIDMSFGADAKRILIATASGVLGRPMKAKVLPGGTVQKVASAPSSNGGGRSRAEQDPIVQKMKEKFGAEIRTIIDYKEKR
jgi:DNA polymerase-3 subunit gamma/tau